MRFAIKDYSIYHSTAKEALLLWCKKVTASYENIQIQNFTSSFSDGLAFCAIIHKHRPELIQYDILNKSNPRENLALAFDVAEKHLNIPQMLDPHPMVFKNPDEKWSTHCVIIICSSNTVQSNLN